MFDTDNQNLEFDNDYNLKRVMIERDIYLSTFKAFNRMSVRMKISFMALQNLQTVKEFMLEKILNSYQTLKQANLIDHDWEQHP
jgi:hypothetical protein